MNGGGGVRKRETSRSLPECRFTEQSGHSKGLLQRQEESCLLEEAVDRLHCDFRWDLLESDGDWNLVVTGSSGAGYKDVRHQHKCGI